MGFGPSKEAHILETKTPDQLGKEIDRLTDKISSSPTEDLYLSRALVFYQLGDSSNCLSDLKIAERLNPKNERIFLGMFLVSRKSTSQCLFR